jgi:hypothetical protein
VEVLQLVLAANVKIKSTRRPLPKAVVPFETNAFGVKIERQQVAACWA